MPDPVLDTGRPADVYSNIYFLEEHMAQKTYMQALNDALREEMERDSKVLIFGEDVGQFGGCFGVTKGLYDQFGEKRVRDTPITESAIIGAATGAAAAGLRPVCELMFVDFIGVCMDQLFNQAAKMRYMFGGKTTIPMVLRAPRGPESGPRPSIPNPWKPGSCTFPGSRLPCPQPLPMPTDYC